MLKKNSKVKFGLNSLKYLSGMWARCPWHPKLRKEQGFTWIPKAVVDQMGSRPPSSDSDLFLM